MSKQTAVKWFWDKVAEILPYSVDTETGMKLYEAFQQAKAMEREQIIDAWNDGDYAYFYSKKTGREFEDGNRYYNEIYKGEANE